MHNHRNKHCKSAKMNCCNGAWAGDIMCIAKSHFLRQHNFCLGGNKAGSRSWAGTRVLAS